MSEQEIKVNIPDDEGPGQPEESQSADAAREESQLKKLSADLADLQHRGESAADLAERVQGGDGVRGGQQVFRLELAAGAPLFSSGKN